MSLTLNAWACDKANRDCLLDPEFSFMSDMEKKVTFLNYKIDALNSAFGSKSGFAKDDVTKEELIENAKEAIKNL